MKMFYVLMALLMPVLSNAQLDHMEIYLGKDKFEVKDALDSLHSLKRNGHVKIEQDFNTYGDFTLATDFAMDDERYYKCFHIYVVFRKLASGREVCVSQTILGTSTEAGGNLDYIKGDFETLGKGVWERYYNDTFKTVAIFKLDDKNPSFYKLNYSLRIVDSSGEKK